MTVMDPDVVSEVNVVRQPFSRVDIGSNKAMCLVARINMFWGFTWKAIPRYFEDSPAVAPECDLLISCVDTRKARHLISQSFKKLRAPAYHLRQMQRIRLLLTDVAPFAVLVTNIQ